MIKKILLDLFIALSLLTAGAALGYMYSLSEITARASEVVNSNRSEYNAADVRYIATGFKMNTNFDK